MTIQSSAWLPVLRLIALRAIKNSRCRSCLAPDDLNCYREIWRYNVVQIFPERHRAAAEKISGLSTVHLRSIFTLRPARPKVALLVALTTEDPQNDKFKRWPGKNKNTENSEKTLLSQGRIWTYKLFVLVRPIEVGRARADSPGFQAAVVVGKPQGTQNT